MQVHLIDLRKRLMLWSFLSVLLLCVCETVHQKPLAAGWWNVLLQAGEIALAVVLLLQLSLIVLISCCNLTTPTRH